MLTAEQARMKSKCYRQNEQLQHDPANLLSLMLASQLPEPRLELVKLRPQAKSCEIIFKILKTEHRES